MLYLLGIIIFIIAYMILGSMYVACVHMYLEGGDWDGVVWLLWPWIAWRRWRLVRLIKRVNNK